VLSRFLSVRFIRIRETCLFLAVLGGLLTLYGCSRVNTDWHRYNGRNFEIIGTNRNLVQVPTDGWRIISTADDQRKNEYEWGWELSMKVEDIPKEKKMTMYNGQELELLLTIKEIQYILLDEDGFELAKDTVRDQSMSYGGQETFRHTSTIPKSKALRAAKSVYKIILL
jgi:hypothetical protein